VKRSECPITVALVGCSKRKAVTEKSLPAKDLYTGSLCRMGYRYAMDMGWDVLFLSALHGVVEPADPIPPYDYSMANIPKSNHFEWGTHVVNTLLDIYPLLHLDIVFLTGKNYSKPVMEAAEQEEGHWTLRSPLEGLDLFGRMRWFKAHSPNFAA